MGKGPDVAAILYHILREPAAMMHKMLCPAKKFFRSEGAQKCFTTEFRVFHRDKKFLASKALSH